MQDVLRPLAVVSVIVAVPEPTAVIVVPERIVATFASVVDQVTETFPMF